jgi:capsular exopolysaccharide synthesis family protein
MRVAVDNAADQEKALLAEVARQEAVAQQLNTQFIPYNTLLRDIEQYRALYDSVIKRMGEATMAGNLDIRTIQVFQEAKTPTSPVKPRRLFVMAASLLAGLGIGLLLAGGFEGMDDSIRTMNDAEAYLRLPVLSTVPRLQSSQVKRRPLVMNDDARFSGAEAFRALRTSLFLHDPDGRNRSFLFTSTMPGEGKTFCALNFAASLAQQGFRTLLVDADLRRPMLEKMILGGKKGVPGVINHLKGEAITIQQTMIENLFLMPAGTIHSNPAELLARNGLRDLLEESLREFDRVVLDSAPIFGVSDTLRLVRDVQVVCLVVRARRTPRKQVRRCLQMLQRASAPLAGIVLNGVPTSRRVAYDSPYHDYGYYGGPPAKPEKKAAAPAVPTGVMNFAPPAPPPNRRAARG